MLTTFNTSIHFGVRPYKPRKGTEENREVIRQKIKDAYDEKPGATQKEIAEEVGVSQSTVSFLKQRD